MISPAVHESLARTTRERCIQEEKEAAVPFTRVPAKEAPSKTNRQSTVGADLPAVAPAASAFGQAIARGLATLHG
jgi:hypothetical protein